MKPNLDEFLNCSARWHGKHQDIDYEISWQSLSDYTPEGIWCYYLLINNQQFYSEDWKRLRLEKKDYKSFGSNWYRVYSYNDFPDLDAHGGWTFGEMNIYLGKDGKEYEQIKIGCDYGHSWDRDSGYPYTKADIELDAKQSIDLLCEMFPNRRICCPYSGQYDDTDQFGTGLNEPL